VPVLGDLDFEAGETVLINLVEVVGGVAGVANGVLTIQNDDLPPRPALGVDSAPAGQMSLLFPTVAGVTYQLQMRTNLIRGTWISSGAPVTGSGQPIRLQFAAPVRSETYYRVRAQ